jgi:hypothetical protein
MTSEKYLTEQIKARYQNDQPLLGKSRGLTGTECRAPTIIDSLPSQARDHEHRYCSQADTPDNMQIFEGTNQIQRLVISRHLASGPK